MAWEAAIFIYVEKKKDGSWEGSENLGKDINSKQMDYCPYVDLKNDVFYFTSKRSGLDAIPPHQWSLPEFLKLINSVDNGESRIYQADFKEYLRRTGK